MIIFNEVLSGRRLILVLGATLVFGFIQPLLAEGVDWESLSATQQETLAGVKSRWNSLPPERQEHMLRGAERWQEMTPAQREQTKARMQQWRDMSPEKKARVRENLARFRNLPPEEQAQLRQRMNRFRALPPEKRKAMRERWRNMTPEQWAEARANFQSARRSPDGGVAGKLSPGGLPEAWHRASPEERHRFREQINRPERGQAEGRSRDRR